MIKKKIFILLIIYLLTLTGCTMNEIEEYSIVAGIGIDYNDGLYEVTYEIYKENNGETTSLTSIIKNGEGKSISSAVNEINNKIYQIPYLNHCLLIILSESIIKQKLDETLNYLIHDVRIRSSSYIVTTEKEKPKEILEKSQESKQVISYTIFKKIDQTPSQVGIWNHCNFDYIMNEKIDKNGVLLIPIVNFQNDLNITKVTMISKNKEIIKANELEIFVIQLFYNSVNEGLLRINDYFFYLKSAKSNYKVNKDVIKINVHLQMLSYDDLGASSKNEEKNKITAYLEKELTLIVKNTFMNFQKQRIDSFGIYKYLQRFRTHFYKEIEDNYNEYFYKLQIDPTIKIDLLTSGLSEERI